MSQISDGFTWVISQLTCHLRYFIVVLETLKLQWQCSQYLTLNPTCILADTWIRLIQTWYGISQETPGGSYKNTSEPDLHQITTASHWVGRCPSVPTEAYYKQVCIPVEDAYRPP